MKRIVSLFAVLVLVASTGLFTVSQAAQVTYSLTTEEQDELERLLGKVASAFSEAGF